MPAPDHLAAGRQLVEQGRAVCRHPAGEHQRLQSARGQHRTGQLLDRSEYTLGAAHPGADSLPGRKEPGQVDRRNGLDLGPQGGQ